jgi:hypothetical protein
MAGIRTDYPSVEILARIPFPRPPPLHFAHYRAVIAHAEGAILLTISGVNAKSARGSAGASKSSVVLDRALQSAMPRHRRRSMKKAGNPCRERRHDVACVACDETRRVDEPGHVASRHAVMVAAFVDMHRNGRNIHRPDDGRVPRRRDAARGARIRRRAGRAVRGAGSCRRWSSAVRYGIRRISAACIRSGSRVRGP